MELVPPRGSDPQGNPEAESAIDTIAHELVEATTDPEGAGWMDPNGFEIGDRCETGPQIGAPLGFAPDGAPYNQLIAGHEYLIQAMWSNGDLGCVDRSASTAAPVRLPTLTLTQYSAADHRPGSRRAAWEARGARSCCGLASQSGPGGPRTGVGGGFSLALRGPAVGRRPSATTAISCSSASAARRS